MRCVVDSFEKNFTKYDKLLSRYENYKPNSRIVKLSYIQGIDYINITYQSNSVSRGSILSLTDAPRMILSSNLNNSCGVINKIDFKLSLYNNSLRVENIVVHFDTIATYYGKIVNDMLKNGFRCTISTNIEKEYVSNFFIVVD